MLPGTVASDSDLVAELLARSFPETRETWSTALEVVLPDSKARSRSCS